MTIASVPILTLDDIAYLRELWANRVDAERALARAVTPEATELAKDAQRNAEAFWTAYGVPLMMSAIEIAERTLKAAGKNADIIRTHAVVLTAGPAPESLAEELRKLADRLENLGVPA